jgi:chromosome segregation ATPase
LPALYDRLGAKGRKFADQERERCVQRFVRHGFMPRETERAMDDDMTRQEFSEYMTGFERRLDGRFGRLDRRLDAVDSKLDAVDRRLDAVDRRLDSVDGRFDSVDGRFDSVDGRFDGLVGRLDGIDRRLDAMDQRFGAMDVRFDAMDIRFDTMSGRLTEHDGRFGRIDAALGDLKQSIAVQFEDTRREIKLSLEAVEGLGERMDRRFDEIRREQSGTTAPLEDAVRHVARQIKSREPSGTKPARQRRS